MKKNPRTNSIRLGISKNWLSIKKNYFKMNLFSMEQFKINNACFSFIKNLNWKTGEIITKEYSNKLLIIIPVVPGQLNGPIYLNKKRKNLSRYQSILWFLNSISKTKNIAIYIHKNSLNSPFLNAKLLNSIFNESIKFSNFKNSLHILKEKTMNINKISSGSLTFTDIALILTELFKNLRVSNNQKKTNYFISYNPNIRFSNTLKNKISLYKFFYKINIWKSLNLQLKLRGIHLLIKPSYAKLYSYLFNLRRGIKLSNKYSIGVKGWSLLFHGKDKKNPRKVKSKISLGVIDKLKIKSNLKMSHNQYFISPNGVNNAKLFLNY